MIEPLTATNLAALARVRHGFFTRAGGVSRGLYASLNVGVGSNDDPAAVAENRRRAVLLILGREVKDASHYDPARVRRYLATVHVPLVVWSLYGPDTALARAWGPVEDVSSLPRMKEAVARLRDELGRQQIVWLDGRHLPQDIALTPAATEGAELVGKQE